MAPWLFFHKMINSGQEAMHKSRCLYWNSYAARAERLLRFSEICNRNGEFEPKLISKYQRDISGIEEKIISLYARGMSTRDIHDQINDLYGIEVSCRNGKQNHR